VANENTNYIVYLLNLAKEGRYSSFLELCEIYLKNVFTLIYRLIGDVDLAKKLTIDTFITVWGELKELNPNTLFPDYIKNIAVDITIIELIKHPYSSEDQSEKTQPKTKLELVERLIKLLPAEEKAIFVLHDLERYSYQKIQKFFPDMILDELKTKLIETRQKIMSKLDL